MSGPLPTAAPLGSWMAGFLLPGARKQVGAADDTSLILHPAGPTRGTYPQAPSASGERPSSWPM
jgi:hypothetical protein